MECKKIEELLSAYIEGELDAAARQEVGQHLDACSQCKELKETMEGLLQSFPELEEEVPFYLKNRLHYIPESQDLEEDKHSYIKWAVAVVGTFILFLNLFYFTNIYPPANRTLHGIASNVGTFVVETGAFFEKIKESKDIFFYSFFNKDSEKNNNNSTIGTKIESNGGKNG